jgi:hypothetical protein
VSRPRGISIGLVTLLVVACSSRSPSPSPISSGQADEAALELVRGIQAEVVISETALVAAAATADFGIEEGLRAVRIRVVDEMAVVLKIAAETDVVLAEPPGLCLVGPFWNPLDAGLSDRCWGDPDLTAVAAEQAGAGAQGQTTLPAGEPVTVAATIVRGSERCDYAPGEWTLEVSVRPLVGGRESGPVRLPDATFTVPIEDPSEPLVVLPLLDTRVCSYPAAVVNRQGEPELVPE